MTPAHFVGLFAKEKRSLLKSYLTGSDSAVGAAIEAMELSARDRKALASVLDGVLTDAF
jgi:hypothetical protein